MSMHFSILIISSSSPTHLIIIVISITKMSNQVPLPSQHRNPAERVQVSSGTGQMKGRGGPENAACRFRGVRQRAWGKWVAELRQPGGPRLWLRTYDNAVDAALAYDTAARRIHGANTRVNFPEGQPPENPPSTQMTLQALVNTDLGLYPPGASSSSPITNISYPG